MRLRPMFSALIAITLSASALAQKPPDAPAPQNIFEAARAGALEMVKALAAKDASLVNSKDAAGSTPLHFAAAAGSTPMVELLISLGADLDAVNTGGRQPLHEAIWAKKPEAALVLIAKGADVNKPGDGMGRTPLHMAALGDVASVVGPLAVKGADLEKVDQQGLSPLVCAVLWSPGIAAVRALIDAGADINATGPRGRTVLDFAAEGYVNPAANVELLLDRGAAYAPDRALPILQVAAAGGSMPLFRKLVAKHGDTLFADAGANRATMTQAVLGSSAEIVQALLAKGIAIDDKPDAAGLTLLHRVAEIPKAAGLIELLVKNGLDIDARTTDGRSAYNLAAGERYRAARRILETLGAGREPQKFPVLTGPYLGQAPPAAGQVPFARGIVINNHGVVVMSSDGLEMYWSSPPSPGAQGVGNRIIVTTLRDGRWTAPAAAPFSCDLPYSDGQPFVSPDNKKLFFQSTRPTTPSGQPGNNIWFVERTPTGWSAPRLLDSEINDMVPQWQFSVSRTGTFCFAGNATTDIYFSRYENGKYSKPVSAGPAINTPDVEACPFLAPDESYLIFSRVSGPARGYFISYRLKDGSWSQPAALKQLRAQPTSFVSPDGKYIFFGYESGFWAPAAFIEELRPKEDK
jgi:ankyrin repeat protein